MRRVCLWSVLMILITPLLSAAPLHRVPGAVPGRYIVTLDVEHPSTTHAEGLSRSAGAILVHTFETVLNGFSIRATEQRALALAKMPGVEAVWEVPALSADDVQSNPADGLDRIDQHDLPPDDSYTYYLYSTPTTMYIVDTGMDPRPLEFGSRVAANVNFYTNASGVRDPNDYTDGGLPVDNSWHGTATAVVGAGANHGVARFVKIANVRVLKDASGGSWDDVVAGVNWVTQQRNARPAELHVANFSGGANYGTAYSGYPPAITAFTASIHAGVAWIFSAGNDQRDGCTHFPGWMGSRYSGAISVGAADPLNDEVFFYSNQGPCVEIYAPSRVQWGDTINLSRATGTSAAAPHAAGVFAMRWANAPASSTGEIEGLIKGVATPDKLTKIWATSNNLLLYSLLPRRRPSGS